MSEVERIIIAPQFEFSENTINEIAENLRSYHIDQVLLFMGGSVGGHQERDDKIKELGEMFSFGVRAGIRETLKRVNDAVLMSTEELNEDEFLNKSVESMPLERRKKDD